ncbi:hypothetical protein ACFLT9_09020 [Acidobacteriota bacterium]
MKKLLSFLSIQSPSPGSQEGLPYWIFWFLLCIILLLMIFIFLRDKDLRRRINLFFFRTKQKLIRLRLQRSLQSEARKMAGFFREMGAKTWIDQIRVQDDSQLFEKLKDLDTEKTDCEKEIQKIERKINKFQKIFNESEEILAKEQAVLEEKRAPLLKKEQSQDTDKIELDNQIQALKKGIKNIDKEIKSAEKEKETLKTDTRPPEERELKEKELVARIKDLNEKKESLQTDLPKIQEDSSSLAGEKDKTRKSIQECNKDLHDLLVQKKHKAQEHHKEIKEWERDKDKCLDKIENIEKHKSPLFIKLGQLVNETRLDHEALSLLYSQIDRSKKRREDLEKQISELD